MAYYGQLQYMAIMLSPLCVHLLRLLRWKSLETTYYKNQYELIAVRLLGLPNNGVVEDYMDFDVLKG